MPCKKKYDFDKIYKAMLNVFKNNKFVIHLLYYILVISASILLILFFVFLDTDLTISKAMVTPFITAITAIIILIYTKETYKLRILENKKYDRELRPILEYKVEQKNKESPFELTLLIHNRSNELISCLVRLDCYIMLNQNSIYNSKMPWKRFNGTKIWNIQYNQTIESMFQMTKAFRWKEQWTIIYNNFKKYNDKKQYIYEIKSDIATFYNKDFHVYDITSFKLLFTFHIISFTSPTNVIPYLPVSYFINLLNISHEIEPCLTSKIPAYKYKEIPEWAKETINNL